MPARGKVLISSGVMIALLGVISAGVSGYMGQLGNEPALAGKRYEVAQTAATEQLKLRLHLREVACSRAYDYLGDETPNPTLTPQQREAVFRAVQDGIASCGGRPVPSGPSPPPGTATSVTGGDERRR